jgi:hypothetical protein
MDLMQLHPKATDDGGDLLRQMEPKDSGEQQGYYSTTGDLEDCVLDGQKSMCIRSQQ